jgi:S-adenosylmethionine:tRNA ribosyltransferase-isomerase
MASLDQYDYELPRELIAQEPKSNRSDARLMWIDRASGSISHHHVRDLPELLAAGDTLVMNNSRVVPARLVGRRTNTNGRWQGLFLRSDAVSGVWEVLTKTRGTLTPGETITIEDRDGRDGMWLRVVARTDDGNLLATPELPSGVAQVPSERQLVDTSFVTESLPSSPTAQWPPEVWLQRFGRIPIPPYIRDGHMVDDDIVRYQTVYAKSVGSVAAPTAGLHFTRPLIEKLHAAGIGTAEVTLHVGIGTFRPIQVDNIEQHQMHHEWASVDEPTVQEIIQRRGRGRTIAVGTTSVRVLESAALDGQLKVFSGDTNLFIRPPYQFKAIDGMMTNFHLPKSSLLVMVSAFGGIDLIREVYRQAIQSEYRFYSYGDCMLIV